MFVIALALAILGAGLYHVMKRFIEEDYVLSMTDIVSLQYIAEKDIAKKERSKWIILGKMWIILGKKWIILGKMRIMLGIALFFISLVLPVVGVSFVVGVTITMLLRMIKAINDGETNGAILLLTVLISVILLMSYIHAEMSYTETREVYCKQELVAIKEVDLISGKFLFLSGNINQQDFYDYRYKVGTGYENGLIPKRGPYIVEDASLTESGYILFYQRYKNYEIRTDSDRIIYSLLPIPPATHIAVGEPEIEIHVPVGTVDNSMKL